MKKIWIDAGHGGTSSGAVFENHIERHDTLRFALELERQFKAQGCETVMTRRTNVDVSDKARTKLERDNKCDLAISCHRNAAAATARGVEAWVHSKAIASTVEWARSTVQAVAAASGMPCRAGAAAAGVYKGYRDSPHVDYFVNRETNSPSMLLELGFITNADDNAAFDSKLPEMCAAVVREALRYLGVSYKSPDSGANSSDESKPRPPESNTADYEALYTAEHEKMLLWQQKAEAAEIRASSAEAVLKQIRTLIGE